MKSIIAAILFTSISVFGASKIVQKFRVTEEKISSAQGCSVAGVSKNIEYGVGYVYTATMKIKVTQQRESFSVQIKKGRFGKVSEIEVPKSTKPAAALTLDKTQSITYAVRYPSQEIEQTLMKACEDEMQFLNTGEYPPPPPKPVIVEVPKKDPPKTPAPTDPLLPPVLVPGGDVFPILPPSDIPGLPGAVNEPTPPEKK